MQEFFPEVITPEVRAFGDRYAEQVPALFAKLSDGPLVLAGRRLAPRQPLLPARRRRDRSRLELVDRSVGPRDLAYLVTESVNVTDRAGYDELFGTYMGELARSA